MLYVVFLERVTRLPGHDSDDGEGVCSVQRAEIWNSTGNFLRNAINLCWASERETYKIPLKRVSLYYMRQAWVTEHVTHTRMWPKTIRTQIYYKKQKYLSSCIYLQNFPSSYLSRNNDKTYNVKFTVLSSLQATISHRTFCAKFEYVDSLHFTLECVYVYSRTRWKYRLEWMGVNKCPNSTKMTCFSASQKFTIEEVTSRTRILSCRYCVFVANWQNIAIINNKRKNQCTYDKIKQHSKKIIPKFICRTSASLCSDWPVMSHLNCWCVVAGRFECFSPLSDNWEFVYTFCASSSMCGLCETWVSVSDEKKSALANVNDKLM